MAGKFKEVSLEVDLDLREPLVVSASDFKGTPRFDVRHYYETDGALRPSKKGINLPLDLVPRLIDALLMAYNEASGSTLAVFEDDDPDDEEDGE